MSEGGRCFVIRPFAEEFQNVWDFAIKPAIERAGLDPWDGQEERLGSNIVHKDISTQIWNAKVIIADVSGRNANVMYELGMAHAAKKPVVMLLEDSEAAPFDVAHIRYMKYQKTNLRALQDKLVERLRSTIDMGEGDHTDFFPELKIITREVAAEMEYLRANLTPLKITAAPEGADIFFNDRWLGHGSANVLVNKCAERNTISATTVGFYEIHRQIETGEIDGGHIHIELEPLRDDGDVIQRLSKRLPAWLRDRRRDPKNPVLMRAIANYLLATGEHADAREEIDELLLAAPGWYLAPNQLGLYYGMRGELDESLAWYKRTCALSEHHYIGHYNMACVYALKGQSKEALEHLRAITENPSFVSTIRAANSNLSKDSDFASLIADPETRRIFRDIELFLFPNSPEPEESAKAGMQGYIF